MSAVVPLRVVAPLVAAYVLFLGIVAISLRRPAERPALPGSALDAGWRPFLRRVGTTALGGYVAFLAIVQIFHVAIAGQRDAMRYAVPGGALLAFGVALPAFALSSALERAIRRRRSPRR